MAVPLVERFIELNRWSDARKTVWLMALALPAQIFYATITRIALNATGIVDMGLFDFLVLTGTGVPIVCMASGWLAERSGRPGRWTAYLTVALYATWIAAFLTSMGYWSTPMAAWVPAVTILVALWYDAAIAWFAFGLGIALGVVAAALTLADVVDYAPAMQGRSLDQQNSATWAATGIFGYSGFFVFAFLLTVLVVAARDLQDVRLERAQSLIRRYVPAQLAEGIISGDDAGDDPPRRTKLTIFFSDLVGFTDVSEELEPEDLSRVLNEYFAAMMDIAHRHGGTVDEISGDAILVFFGAPYATDDQDHALRAVRMALEMQAAVPVLNDGWRRAGITESLQVRMGVNTGVVTIGNFGSQDRMKYAVLGKHVNLAARLQSHCEPGRVLVSHSTWLLVGEEIACTPKGEFTLKGLTRPVAAYEPAAG